MYEPASPSRTSPVVRRQGQRWCTPEPGLVLFAHYHQPTAGDEDGTGSGQRRSTADVPAGRAKDWAITAAPHGTGPQKARAR